RGRDLAILDECESANDEHEKAQHLQHASIHERTPCAAGARAGDDDLRDMDESRMRGIRHGSGNSPPDGRTPRPARSVRAPPHGPTNLPEGAGRATVGTADRLRIVGDTPPKRPGLPDGHPRNTTAPLESSCALGNGTTTAPCKPYRGGCGGRSSARRTPAGASGAAPALAPAAGAGLQPGAQSTRATPSPARLNLVNTAGSCPGTIRRGE